MLNRILGKLRPSQAIAGIVDAVVKRLMDKYDVQLHIRPTTGKIIIDLVVNDRVPETTIDLDEADDGR